MRLKTRRLFKHVVVDGVAGDSGSRMPRFGIGESDNSRVDSDGRATFV